MVKELIISISIIVSIVALDFITQNYTKDSIMQTSAMLNNLKNQINEEGKDLKDNVEQIFNNWKDKTDKLAYFIEHNELEKVDKSLTDVRSFIELGNFEMANNSIDEAVFLLEHIKDKNALKLENIF